MGKKARIQARRRQSPTGNESSTDALNYPPIVRATAELIEALEVYARAVAINTMALQILKLPKELEQIARYASGRARQDLKDLTSAWRIVYDNEPVAPAGPHSDLRQDESWRRWTGPLTPEQLLYYASIATPADQHYRDQLKANQTYFVTRAQQNVDQRKATCGRDTKKNTPCGNIPLYMPPDGFLSGYPCWIHATVEEKDIVRRTYRRAIADHDCPGCTAKAGQPCYTGDDSGPNLRLVEGEWARTRKADNISIHDVRLRLQSPEAAST